jgi:hypothetical protein
MIRKNPGGVRVFVVAGGSGNVVQAALRPSHLNVSFFSSK